MKHKFRRTLTTALAFFAMLLSFALFAYAESGETERETFRGRIFSNDDIDVSGIEIEVYSSVLTDDDGNGIQVFENFYEKSVYADKNGNFEFEKPSEYCMYSVVAETLPIGYGIFPSSRFLDPGQCYFETEISMVAEVRTELHGSSISPSFFDSNGRNIYDVKYTDVPNRGYIKGSVISRDYSVKEYESIKSFDTYVYSGIIKVGDKEFPYSHDRDFSDYTVIEKAEFLYSVGEITESERYKCYEELLNDPYAEYGPCGTWIVNDIAEYKSRTGGYAEINSANSTTPPYDTVYPIVIENEIVNVCYTASSFLGSDETYLTDFFAAVEDIYTYYCIENGFKEPYGPKNSGDANFSTLKVYITDQVIASENGRTYILPEGSSCIWIKESHAKTSLVSQTLAHEFMHAINYAHLSYGSSGWFNESIPTMASMIYQYDRNNYVFNDIQKFNDYGAFTKNFIDNYRTSLQNNHAYGAMLYPLCVYLKYGKWSAIEEIILNRSAGYSDLGSFGIGGNSSHGYDEKFIRMSVCNIYPDIDYGITTLWPKLIPNTASVPSENTGSVKSMANEYYRYSASSNMGTLKIIASSGENVEFTLVTQGGYFYKKSGRQNATLRMSNFGTSNKFDCTLAVTNVGAATASFSIKSSLE